FPPGSFTIETKKDAKSGPTLVGKKEPIYTKLICTVTTHGEVANLVGFLERFYRTGLLHQIKTLSIQRPQTTAPGQKPTDLDINLTSEALVLRDGENRPYLAPVDAQLLLVDALSAMRRGPTGVGVAVALAGPAGPLGARQLAVPTRQYASIQSKDLFFG